MISQPDTVNINPLQAIVPVDKLTTSEFRGWIEDTESRMVEHGSSFDRHSEESPIKLEHTFTPGLYVREIFMPAGSLVISRIHLFEHPYMITKGSVSVYDGEDIVFIEAPFRGITKAGTKRILYVHTDTTWTTFHVTDKTTFEEIDVDGVITCGSFSDFEQIAHKEIEL